VEKSHLGSRSLAQGGRKGWKDYAIFTIITGTEEVPCHDGQPQRDLPAVHESQSVCPGSLWKFPRPQGVGSAILVSGHLLPLGQARQDFCPCWSW
jgi:hypothetical protein